MNSTPVVPAPALPALGNGPRRHVIDQATANLIARVNAVSVTVEDMFLAAAEIQKLALETCNRKVRTRCLGEIFKGQRYKPLAVNFRLEAMAAIVGSGKIARWVLPNIVAEPVFKAAANAPVLLAGEHWFFEQDSFVASVLEYAQVDGHA